MIAVRFELDKKQLRSAGRDLKKLESRMPKILSRTADKTATSARMLLVKGMQDTYTIKSSGAKKGMEIKKASGRDPAAVIKVSGRPQPSIRFRHSKGGRDGVKLQVRTDDPFQAIKPVEGRKAFTAQMPSGHKGIFQRRADEFMEKSPRLSKPRVRPRTKHTESLMERMSISPAGMAGNVFRGSGGLSEGLGPEIEGLFQKYFGQQIELTLGRKKKGGA
ncbi:MAG: hypothetical protein HFH59_06885 [Lachnospiraceae bacterium]|nr:hypothetical protein [Lachnospiraceae bacterium]